MQVPELDFFEKFSLEELQERAPMNRRVDQKYILSKEALPEVLAACAASYQLLTINSKHVFDYDTWYYDTPEYSLYHHHHQGKGNRFKVRKRYYVQSGETFVEVKKKNNKGITEKYRKLASDLATASDFIFDNTALKGDELVQSLAIQY